MAYLEDDEDEGNPGSKSFRHQLIRTKPISKRTAITHHQVALIVDQIEILESALLRHFGVQSRTRIPRDRFIERLDIKEYHVFHEVLFACNIVCEDFKEEFPLGDANARPEEVIDACTLYELRLYLYTLQRAEKNAHAQGSPILSALISGALTRVAERLHSDQSLYDHARL